MSQRLGKAFIKWDGKLLESMPDAKLDLGGVTRTPVTGANAVLGFSEKVKESTIECEISMSAETRLAELAAIKDATITFECDTGQTYIIRNGFLIDPPSATAGDGGKVPLKFSGPAAEEMA